MAVKRSTTGQILLFPSSSDDSVDGLATSLPAADPKHPRVEVVLSGSYRKDPEGLRRAFEELRDTGCEILSPISVDASKEIEGFVYMRGEEADLPTSIESRHLDAIERASFVWLHAPGGYVGTSAALEVGFANAIGVPVFTRETVADRVIRSFVRVSRSPQDVLAEIASGSAPVPAPGIRTFQHYYRKVATQRGYERETAQDCLILMLEELGELARAIRRRRKLVRHGAPLTQTDEAQELSDVFIYVVHMANVLNVDLSRSVQAKELLNVQRFLKR